MKLTHDQREELDAVSEVTAATGKPSFIHRCNWRGLYQSLVQRGLVTWGPHPDFGPMFRSVELTDAGRESLASSK